MNLNTPETQQHFDAVRQEYERGKQSTQELAQASVEGAKEAMALGDAFVRTNAWSLLGAALLLGIIVGLVLEPD